MAVGVGCQYSGHTWKSAVFADTHRVMAPPHRYPEIPLVFADSSRVAENWTYRFLSTALADTSDPGSG
jgi:hypothetical protein